MSPTKGNKIVIEDPCSQGTTSTIYFSADAVPNQNEGSQCELTQSQEWVKCTDEDSDKALNLKNGTSVMEEGKYSSEYEDCTEFYEKDVDLTCFDIKQFRVTLVTDCFEDIPSASFKGGDRDVNVTVDQLSRFLKEPTMYLEAKIVSIEPVLRKGAEVEGLSLKCLQCKTIQIWQDAMRNSEDGSTPICSNKKCGPSKLACPTFVFKFSLSHGAGNSTALLMKKQARHFFGFTEEEFLRRKEVRDRLRMDLEELVESDLIFKFSLKLVEGDTPFVYLIHNMRVVRI